MIDSGGFETELIVVFWVFDESDLYVQFRDFCLLRGWSRDSRLFLFQDLLPLYRSSHLVVPRVLPAHQHGAYECNKSCQ